jgi:hypothetical protein
MGAGDGRSSDMGGELETITRTERMTVTVDPDDFWAFG